MKKILLSMAAVMVLFAACDPKEDSYSDNAKTYSEEALSESFSITQSDADGNAAADGNYITFNTSPATIVTVYNLLSDGSENILSKGTASGSFSIVPRRGADPVQTYYVRTLNADGTWTTVEKQVTVYVPSDLTTEMKLLASDSYGSKIWKWDTEFRADGGVWGNLGYAAGDGDTFVNEGNGIWWGCKPEYLENPDEKGDTQLQHSDTGVGIGEGDPEAYMEFFDDGRIITYDANGKQIRSGSFSVEGYTGERNHASKNGEQANWSYGTFKATAGSILWPFEINNKSKGHDACPTEFEIMQLDASHLKLIYPDGNTTGGWSEATWWAFKSVSDPEASLTNFGTKAWTWDTEFRSDGGVWGNLGYAAGDGSTFVNDGNGIWWGCKPEYLENPDEKGDTQLQHSDTGEAIGEGDPNAYMTFDLEAGRVTSYDANGKQLRQGVFSISAWNNGQRTFASKNGEQANWALGSLTTTAGSILWPFEINNKTKGDNPCPTVFEILQLDADHLKLIYPDSQTSGGWSEATWWAFKAKK